MMIIRVCHDNQVAGRSEKAVVNGILTNLCEDFVKKNQEKRNHAEHFRSETEAFTNRRKAQVRERDHPPADDHQEEDKHKR